MAVSVGCHDRHAEPVLRFWAMGREGEVVQRLVPDFERAHPGVRVRVQQIPWSAAHEKLLTAYVGGSTPDVVQLGNTWIPEFVALGALEPLDERLRRSTAVPADDFFPGHLGHERRRRRAPTACRGTSTRACSSTARDLLAARRLRHARRGPGTTGARRWRRSMKRAAGPDASPILLPINEWQPLVILALQRGAPLLRDGDTRGDFRERRRSARAFAFYLDLFRRGLAPRASQAQVANLYQEFARGSFALLHHRAVEPRRVPRRLPPELQPRGRRRRCPAPDGGEPGVSLAGGSSLVLFRGSPRKDAAWQLIEFLSRARAAGRASTG